MAKQSSNASERPKGRSVWCQPPAATAAGRIVPVGRGDAPPGIDHKRQNKRSARVNPQGACAQISGSQRRSSPPPLASPRASVSAIRDKASKRSPVRIAFTSLESWSDSLAADPLTCPLGPQRLERDIRARRLHQGEPPPLAIGPGPLPPALQNPMLSLDSLASPLALRSGGLAW
jgi:hypothetical protein